MCAFDWHQGGLFWMTLNGYQIEFSPKFALSNFKRYRKVAGQVRLLWQLCLVDLLTHWIGGGTVGRA